MATEKKITSRIQQKHDVAANWAKATNFIPKKGEIIIYDAEYSASGVETQAVRFKIGDGSKTVNNLPFAVIDYSSDIETLEQKVANNSTAIGALQENTVPKTRKINNKALSSDITLGAADVGVNETTFPGLKKTGTVTGVKMNGATKTPSSGIVDLGTVLTDASKFATAAQGTKADDAMPKSGGTFTGNISVPNTITFTGTTNPYIKMTTGGTDFYFQSTSGQFGLGPTWNKATHWDSNGNVTFPTTPKVGSSQLALKSDIPDASKHGYTELTNEDLNTITEAGWYRAESGNTCKHRPDAFTSTMSFVLEVEKSTDAYTKQTMYKTNANVDSYFTTYIRFSVDSGNTWSSWRRNQIMSEGYQQTFSGRKTFSDGINIYRSPLLFNDSNGSNGQFVMSQGSTTSPKWVNLQVKVNGTTYTADSDGLIDLGTISGGGTTTYNSIGNNIY